MAVSEVYGRLLDAHQIEESALTLLKTWAPYYLREKERQTNRTAGIIQLPKSYTRVNTFSRAFLETQLPSVVVVSPGLADHPTRDGRGNHRARWELGFAVIFAARHEADTNDICKLYTAALRSILLQQKINLEGVRGITWVDERYDDLPAERNRSLAVGQSLFELEIDNIVNWKIGPVSPTGDPLLAPGDWPLVQVADVEGDRL